MDSATGNAGQRRPILLKRIARVLVPVTLAVNLAIWTFAIVVLHQSRQDALERVNAATTDISTLVEHEVSSILDRGIVALGLVVSSAGDPSRKSEFLSPAFWRILEHADQSVPEVSAIVVFDADGKQLCAPDSRACLRTTATDRDYFVRLKSAPLSPPGLWGPYRSRLNGEWVIVLARPITSSTGEFHGVTVAVIPLDRIRQFLARLDLGRGGAVNIRTADLVQVIRYPGAIRSDDENVNRKVSKQLESAVAANPAGGWYNAPTALDGIERQNTYRRFSKYPLYVLVGMANSDVLNSWTSLAWRVASACTVLLLFSIAAAAFLARVLHVHTETHEELASTAARLSAIAGSKGLSAIAVDARGKVRWESTAFTANYGWTRERLAEASASLIFPTDQEWSRFMNALTRALKLGTCETLELPLVRSDGSHAWVMASASPLSHGSADDPECLVLFIDRTEEERDIASLQRDRENTQAAVENGGVGLWCINRNTGEAWTSRAHAEIFGRDPSKPWTLDDLFASVHPEDLPRVKEAAIFSPAPGPIEWAARIRKPDGSVRRVLARGHSFVDSRRVVYQSGSVVDITDQR